MICLLILLVALSLILFFGIYLFIVHDSKDIVASGVATWYVVLSWFQSLYAVFSWPCLIYICDNYEAHCSNQNLVFKVSFLIKDRVDSEHLKDIGNVFFFASLDWQFFPYFHAITYYFLGCSFYHFLPISCFFMDRKSYSKFLIIFIFHILLFVQ